MTDRIRWINHAGYELQTGPIRIVHDPWVSGLAFGNGWALLAESAYTPADFIGVDYIWLSHEHPDHFSPSLLRSIPETARRDITILFQQTRDKRVVDHCRNLGFRIQELASGARTRLADGVWVTCGVVGFDSWLFLETPHATYFNANDVVGARWHDIARSLQRPVDVLLTQFSFAQWVGNPEEEGRIREQALRKFREMEEQIRLLKPSTLIPFASYIWFCREENFHFNSHANRVEDVFARFHDRVNMVVLYPDDVWDVGSQHDNMAAISRYRADHARHDAPLPMVEDVVSWEELQLLDAKQQSRLRMRNAMWALAPLRMTGWIQPVSIFLTDLQLGLSYSMFGGFGSNRLAREDCDLEMASSSMAAMLRNGYGYGTLTINGRLRERRAGSLALLSRHFAIPLQNDQGFGFPGLLLRRDYVIPQLKRFLGRIRPASPQSG